MHLSEGRGNNAHTGQSSSMSLCGPFPAYLGLPLGLVFLVNVALHFALYGLFGLFPVLRGELIIFPRLVWFCSWTV